MDEETHEEATESVTFPMPDPALKPPHVWAVEKGFLKLNDDGSIHFKTHTPWEFYGARVARKWSDPLIDPTFAISEAEFDEAIAYVLGVTAG